MTICVQVGAIQREDDLFYIIDIGSISLFSSGLLCYGYSLIIVGLIYMALGLVDGCSNTHC